MSETRVEIIRRLARRGAGNSLHRALEKARPVDIAAAIGHLAPAEQRLVMGQLQDLDQASEVLARVEASDLATLAQSIPFERLVKLLDSMDFDDEADVIDRLPGELREKVLEAIASKDKPMVEEILAWPEDSAGGIMQPLAFRLKEETTCREAIAALHTQQAELETVFYIYVENDGGQLVGVTSLRALLTHPPSTPLKELMTTDIIVVAPHEDQEEVARIVSRYDLLAVPVVDENRRMLGIVTVDDVVDVIKEEAIEDMMLMAGVGDELEEKEVPVWRAARQRFAWLVLTLCGGIAMAEVVGVFQTVLQKQAVLAGFIPVMLGTGGNVGTQAATVAVRAIATGEIANGNSLSTIFRETRIGLLLGLAFAVTLGGYALLRWMEEPRVGAAIGGAILLTAATAATVGATVPLLLRRVGVDPAVATGPFVTTCIDLLAMTIYFVACTLLFGL